MMKYIELPDHLHVQCTSIIRWEPTRVTITDLAQICCTDLEF